MSNITSAGMQSSPSTQLHQWAFIMQSGSRICSLTDRQIDYNMNECDKEKWGVKRKWDTDSWYFISCTWVCAYVLHNIKDVEEFVTDINLFEKMFHCTKTVWFTVNLYKQHIQDINHFSQFSVSRYIFLWFLFPLWFSLSNDTYTQKEMVKKRWNRGRVVLEELHCFHNNMFTMLHSVYCINMDCIDKNLSFHHDIPFHHPSQSKASAGWLLLWAVIRIMWRSPGGQTSMDLQSK